MNPVRLSMCLICGDAHVEVLARCLKSILARPEGPAADEIVIGWNGARHDDFAAALHDVFGPLDGISNVPPLTPDIVTTFYYKSVRVVLHRYVWTNRFDDARRDNYDHATGAWRCYIDVDDIICGVDDPAYKDSLEIDPPIGTLGTEGIGGKSFPENCSLPEFVSSLPSHVNCVWAPYNYVTADKGRPLIRKRRPRIVRWDRYWVWTSEIHEILRHALGREMTAWCPTVVFLHQPVEDERIRVERNAEVLSRQVERLKIEGAEIPASLLYSMAAKQAAANRFAEAKLGFYEAAKHVGELEERAHFMLQSFRYAVEEGDYAFGWERAKDAVESAPDQPGGYLAFSELTFRIGKFDLSIKWYEASKGKVPSGPMLLDDRLERCLRPARYVGIAYARGGQYEQALEAAEAALKQASDPFAERLASICRTVLSKRKISDQAVALAETLLADGFPKAAKRILQTVETATGPGEKGKKALIAVEAKLAEETRTIPPDSSVCQWFANAAPEDTIVAYPIDAAEDPEALLNTLAGTVAEGTSLLVAATDPQAADAYALASRVDSVSGERLLSMLEKHGEVIDISYCEDSPTRGFIASRTIRRRGVAYYKPDVTFFCPVFAEPWGPWRILHEGTGGSEEAVIYLTRELAAMGLRVDVYAPLDQHFYRGVHVEGGVRWRHLDSFDAEKTIPGIAVSCRAPWAVRLPAFAPERLYAWHQDAQYGSAWTPVLAKAIKHFWVSKWQREVLLGAVNLAPKGKIDNTALFDEYGAVVGDGISSSSLQAPWDEDVRVWSSAVYLSSPMRGLYNLMQVWPAIHSAVPEATLRLYYGWNTAPGSVINFREELMRIVRSRAPLGVSWVGRVPQFALERELPKHSVWLYPCSDFDECYAMAGVRAAAAGLIPVYTQHAAMAECQYPSPFSAPDRGWFDGGYKEFADFSIAAFKAAKDRSVNREDFRRWASDKTWDRVAAGMIAEWERRGLLGERKEAVLG